MLASLGLALACADEEHASEPSSTTESPAHGDDAAARDDLDTGQDAAPIPGDEKDEREHDGEESARDAGADATSDAIQPQRPGDAGRALSDAAPTPSDASPATDAAAPPVTVFLAGDSIVQTYADTASDRDQAGWGQMLGTYFDKRVSIENHAIGGRTARRFIDEKLLDAIVRELAPGDYLLVEFGTNDGNRNASYMLGDQTIPYFLDPQTDFKSYLQRYVDAARERKALPVFVTPPPRNSAYCTGGNGTAAHANAMKELGQALSVPVVDLNARTVGHLRTICPAPSPEDFFLLRADGTVDGTHFQEHGARTLAGFVVDELVKLGVPLGSYRVTPR